ncbi:MAG TPA: A24 family peptidase [Patescibacteria group bacterium]|nr:A24 family peptidase [Patescibacteria group bacterium]
MTILTLWWDEPAGQAAIAGLLGVAWGFASDRLAARWPAHEDGSIRAIDWRTPVVMLVGAAAFAGTVLRFGATPTSLIVVGLYVVALVVLFATDLDQRLLPDLITLPLIAYAVLVYVVGASPFLTTTEDLAWAVGASIVVPAALYLLAIPFGRGAIGQGDLKLLVSVGILSGAGNLFYALIGGALLAGIVVGVLLFVRRISLKTYVPYGPFLIAGILWAILGLAQP